LAAEAPRSTGTGDNVEWIGAVLESLSQLGGATTENRLENESEEITRVTKAIAKRAKVLQEGIWKVLSGGKNSGEVAPAVLSAAELQGQISALQSQIRDYEVQIAELTKSREEALDSDRKVRRGLYRLAAGRMKLQEVLKAVEDSDKDGMAALMALEEAQDPAAPAAAEATSENGDQAVDNAQVERLKKQLQDLEEVASSREQQIEKVRPKKKKKLHVLSTITIATDFLVQHSTIS
jgi:chromosome segregation ATPase